MNMGVVGSLVWMNTYSKRQCRSLFWRTRAALKKAVKNGKKQQLRFQYDPSSYALNFDDGCCHLEGGADRFQEGKLEEHPASNSTTWVYVLWVKPN
ncbi:hypothetical protein PVL29_012820 [Vitis rotundifolia]|uniref:Uncharacterized protein n=1 Tax=Vitis rotundifolia TaxID=103349 RepID=A0AA38ZJR8_VITRO|nr:hypothetical protein PVL29_012820 [Vitis rotundifolia]